MPAAKMAAINTKQVLLIETGLSELSGIDDRLLPRACPHVP